MMDMDWIHLCRQGDALALERLVCTYQERLYRLALSILDDPDEAEDAVQEAFLAALKELHTFHGTSTFSTWLFAITINVCRTRLRRRKGRRRIGRLLQNLFRLNGNGTASIEESVIQKESDSKVWKAVEKMDEKHRLPVLLRYYHGCSVAEIAETLGIPQGTVHSRLNHARELLRIDLEEGEK